MGVLEKDVQKVIAEAKARSMEPDAQARYEQWVQDQRRMRIDDLMNRAKIPRLYREASFDDLVVTEDNKEAIQICRSYVETCPEDFRDIKSLALFGVPGVGKTHLAIVVLRELIHRYAIPGRYAHVLHSLEDAKSSFGGDGVNPINSIKQFPFLVLDDLGSERSTNWALEQVSRIIDFRVNDELPTLITSNANSWSGLVKMLMSESRGDIEARSLVQTPVVRIIDRLRDVVGDPVVIKGKSWRGREIR